MTSETRLAFDHPEARAAATASPQDPPDRLSLRDHIVDVEIGAFQAERDVTQRLAFNVVVEIAPLPADLDDDVDRILSYDRVTEAIAFELAAERLNLLETLAERIADRILLEPQALRVFLRIEKLDRGPGRLGVEIVRSKAEAAAAAAEDEAPRPRLLYLSNAAIGSAQLAGWISQMQARGGPLILCVGPHGLDLPPAANAAAQRRIELLAAEQNAWRLAALDARCAVVATRTELDWAMKNGQICIWAPSKLVLDAGEGAAAPPQGPVALAAWFAAAYAAQELVVIGAALPDETGVPMRALAVEQAEI